MGRRKTFETEEEGMERRSLAILVRAIRAALGWSQQDLANQLGLSTTSVAKIEACTLRLSRSNHHKLLKLLEDTTVDYFYGPDRITVTFDSSVISLIDPTNGKSYPKKQNYSGDGFDGHADANGDWLTKS